MNKSSAIHIAAVVVIAALLFILPPLWGWSGLPAIIIPGLLIVTTILVRWHARHTGYRCGECGGAFMISAWTDFLSPHLSDRKLLRCPHCLASGWCQEIEPGAVGAPPDAPRVAAAPSDYSPGNLYLQMILVILLYAALWAVALYQWSAISTPVSFWRITKIPIATAVLPIMHFVFCFFAVRHAYRSRMYAMVTIFVAVFLLLAVWTQLRSLPPAI